MKKPIILIDYATDEVYGFQGPFFFSLDFRYARDIVDFFCFGSHFIGSSNTAEFLSKYEDDLSGINRFLNNSLDDFYREKLEKPSSKTVDEYIQELREEHSDWFNEIRLEFRSLIEPFKNWPLSQLLFSSFYRYMIFLACPYQNSLWDLLVEDPFKYQKINKKLKRIHELYESGDASGVVSACDQYLSTSKLNKEVKLIGKTCWAGILQDILFRTGKERLSLEIVALFSDFVNRHPGFTRERKDLQKGILSILGHVRFTKNYCNAENYTYFSFIIVPLLEIAGIPSLEARVAFLNYVKREDIESFEKLLIDTFGL